MVFHFKKMVTLLRAPDRDEAPDGDVGATLDQAAQEQAALHIRLPLNISRW